MTKRIPLAAVALAMSAAAIVPSAAEAQRYGGGYYDQQQRYDRGYYGQQSYDRGYYNDRYQGRDDRDYRRYKQCRREGDAGTIIGAIAGGLLGRALPGNNTTGTILGAAGGALAGRAIDKADRPGYCR